MSPAWAPLTVPLGDCVFFYRLLFVIYFTPRSLALCSALAWPLMVGAQSAAPANTTNSSPNAATPASEAQVLRFDILEFVIDGNTLLPASLVEAAVYPFLGESRTVADAEGARKALEARYHDAGYLSVVVELPPQKVQEAQGAIRLHVTEATLAQVRVSDARYHLPSQIKSGMPSLQAGRPPNFLDMQEDLSALSRQAPDRELTPLVTAGAEEGTMEVDLKVQDTLPLHGSLEVNSKQSPNTQRTRVETSLSYDNLWQKQHSLGLYWFYSPLSPAQSNVLSVNYQLPLGQPGDRLYMTLTTSNSDTPTPLGGLTASLGETYALSWRRNLNARGSYVHATTFQLDLRDLKDRNDNVAEFTPRWASAMT
jgi:hemolysin activation/secretion protein